MSGLEQRRNLRIIHKKKLWIQDLRISDCRMSPRLCGFAIYGMLACTFTPWFNPVSPSETVTFLPFVCLQTFSFCNIMCITSKGSTPHCRRHRLAFLRFTKRGTQQRLKCVCDYTCDWSQTLLIIQNTVTVQGDGNFRTKKHNHIK